MVSINYIVMVDWKNNYGFSIKTFFASTLSLSLKQSENIFQEDTSAMKELFSPRVDLQPSSNPEGMSGPLKHMDWFWM